MLKFFLILLALFIFLRKLGILPITNAKNLKSDRFNSKGGCCGGAKNGEVIELKKSDYFWKK